MEDAASRAWAAASVTNKAGDAANAQTKATTPPKRKKASPRGSNPKGRRVGSPRIAKRKLYDLVRKPATSDLQEEYQHFLEQDSLEKQQVSTVVLRQVHRIQPQGK